MPGTDHIRSFAKFFTNLTVGQRQEFERVLADLQNSKEITSLETSLNQLKRNVNQSLPIPQLTARPTVRGASVEWEPIDDVRIYLYEIDLADNSNFASFTTTTTRGSSTVIDGLQSTKFVRVRGVRRDGTTTPYSAPVEINPRLFDITTRQDEDFYVKITGTDANTVVGGSGSNLSYTPINENGQSMVWGFISTYGDPNAAMFGASEIKAQVFTKVFDATGALKSETENWRLTIGEFFNSQAIGPFTVEHPELNESIEIRLDVTDGTKKANGDPRHEDSTEVLWAHLNVIELGLD